MLPPALIAGNTNFAALASVDSVDVVDAVVVAAALTPPDVVNNDDAAAPPVA